MQPFERNTGVDGAAVHQRTMDAIIAMREVGYFSSASKEPPAARCPSIARGRVCRRQPRVGETLQGIEFRAGQPRQVDHSDHMMDRIVRIASNLYPVSISLGMPFAHQPFAGIQSHPTIIGFQ